MATARAALKLHTRQKTQLVFLEIPIPQMPGIPHMYIARPISVVMTAAIRREVPVFMGPTAPATKTDGLK